MNVLIESLAKQIKLLFTISRYFGICAGSIKFSRALNEITGQTKTKIS